MKLPNWNMAGVVPPIRPGVAPTDADRSPYTVSMPDFVEQFCLSSERSSILDGFIRLRADLHSIGVTQGFQWVDGSFLENVENIESRSPNDIDVVTWAFLPAGHTQQSFFPVLKPYIEQKDVKAKYRVDHYFKILPNIDIHDVCYWYSLWSHRRDGTWKGFAEVDLCPSQDLNASNKLSAIVNGGFQS